MLTFRRGNWRWGKSPKLTRRQKQSQQYFANGGIWRRKKDNRMQSTNVGEVKLRHRTEPDPTP